MKKILAIFVAILLGGSYAAYQNPEIRAYFQRKTQSVLPASATQQTLYRWKDKHGNWQISDKPPASGVKYETVHYPTNANVIPSHELTGKKSN